MSEEKVYTTSVGAQADIDIPADDLPGRITSVGAQVELFSGADYPPDPRVTSVYFQVDIGDYTATPRPIRRGPQPSICRVLPIHPASRVLGQPVTR